VAFYPAGEGFGLRAWAGAWVNHNNEDILTEQEGFGPSVTLSQQI
jgi:hypothetical protein